MYDRLAISVSGDLLEDIYLQNRKSMVIEQAGGAQAKVKKVEILNAVAEETPLAREVLTPTAPNGPPWERSATGDISTHG